MDVLTSCCANAARRKYAATTTLLVYAPEARCLTSFSGGVLVISISAGDNTSAGKWVTLSGSVGGSEGRAGSRAASVDSRYSCASVAISRQSLVSGIVTRRNTVLSC